MMRRCIFPGCNSTSNLLSFPKNHLQLIQWLRILGLPVNSVRSIGKICVLHFSPECFTNYTQAQMGFAVRLRLAVDALPNRPQSQPSNTLKDVGCQTEGTADAFCQAQPHVNHMCQTAQIKKRNVLTQANMEPLNRGKVKSPLLPTGASTLEFPPLDFESANGAPVKRFRCDPCSYRDDGSNIFKNESTTAADRPESYQEPQESEPEVAPVELESEPEVAPVELESEVEVAPVELESEVEVAPVELESEVEVAPVELESEVEVAPVEEEESVGAEVGTLTIKVEAEEYKEPQSYGARRCLCSCRQPRKSRPALCHRVKSLGTQTLNSTLQTDQ